MANFEIASVDVAFFAILIEGIQMKKKKIHIKWQIKIANRDFFFNKTSNHFDIYLKVS
jgi:hypothetical protein